MNAQELYEISHQIIPSCEQMLRRKLSAVDPITLRDKHTNGRDVSDITYRSYQQETKQYHDLCEHDPGFIDFYDEVHGRHIYVVTKEIGYSKIFHQEYDIQRVFDTIRPRSWHDHSFDMTDFRKNWFTTNIENVCLQMFDSDGNIAIFCNSGRSRSPMYVVAYIIMFRNESLDEGMKIIERLLYEQRGQPLDRHHTLYGIVASIAELRSCKPSII